MGSRAQGARSVKQEGIINLSKAISRARDSFLDLLFPRRCVACDRLGEFICPECESGMPVIGAPRCHRCGNPGSSPCLCIAEGTRIWPLDGMRSAFLFESPVREAVLALKYANLRSVGRALSGYAAEMLTKDNLYFDVLVPVPLHGRRLRQRGYNQSQIIAGHLGKELGIEVESRLLRRITHAGPQARAATADERRANVARAFQCGPGSLEGRKIALIDDVTTTGATLRACASALKRAGAGEVWGVTVAREL